MEPEKNLQLDICDFLFRKALLEKELVDYLKNQGYIFEKPEAWSYYKETWAIQPEHYLDWLENREWKDYPNWVAVKIL